MDPSSKPVLSVFRHVDMYRQASQIAIANFCATIDQELEEDPTRDVLVTEVTHYKEKVDYSLQLWTAMPAY
jgi:hypothetical protein